MSNLLKLKSNEKFSIVTNAANTSAEILIYAPIGGSMWEEGITAQGFSEELSKVPSSVKELNIRINSGGGSVFEGMTIYERLKTHKARKIVYVDGLAASIASIIAMAGDEIIVGDGSMMMIHKPSGGAYGQSEEMRNTADLLDKIEVQMVNIYHKKTGMSKAEIEKSLLKDTWFSAEECISNGFATKMSEASAQLKFVASLVKESPWIRSRPDLTATNAIIKQQIMASVSDVTEFLARK